MKIISLKCAQKGVHLPCANNHYAKFENKGMKTVAVTYYTNYAFSKHFECMSKIRKYQSHNAQNYKVHIFNVCTIIMQRLNINE